jgi:hypothetical protein
MNYYSETNRIQIRKVLIKSTLPPGFGAKPDGDADLKDMKSLGKDIDSVDKVRNIERRVDMVRDAVICIFTLNTINSITN